ncbi:hypothetical protein Fmac_000112 [Flemingia macrophylla]|uniref:Secreted protein n=1 Tax=Flemingia macrophylla TaxID=520843 RepID=A0ABD1NEL8_9FABA
MIWWSLLVMARLHLFALTFKFSKALNMAFLTTFLEVKNFLTSTLSSTSPPLLLLIVDCSSRVHSLVCSKASLVAVHASRSLRDPSNRSSTHFSWRSWTTAS